MLVAGLTSSAKLGLGLTAAVFVAFSLIAALVIPRRNPDFPDKHLKGFLVACVVLFVAMLSAVLIFGGKEKAETEAAREKLPVGESDYSMEVPRTNLPPGLYTLEVTNYGQITHNLTVKAAGRAARRARATSSRARARASRSSSSAARTSSSARSPASSRPASPRPSPSTEPEGPVARAPRRRLRCRREGRAVGRALRSGEGGI